MLYVKMVIHIVATFLQIVSLLLGYDTLLPIAST